jgi:hypothetical protein
LSKIIREVDHGIRVVAGVQVRMTEVVWSDAGTSFEVHRVDTGTDLTEDECFDEMPTDDQIAALLAPPAGWFAGPGCGAVFSDEEGGLYVDHVRDCDRVDAAGNPLPTQP